jgi:hypothetical protein
MSLYMPSGPLGISALAHKGAEISFDIKITVNQRRAEGYLENYLYLLDGSQYQPECAH